MLRVKRKPSLEFKHQAFAYQVAAVEAVRNLEYSAVFHEQGLGKTKICLDLALLWLSQDEVDSVLIVTKKGLIVNWRDEISRHTYLRARVLNQVRKDNFYAFNSPVRLYLAHYEVIRSEAKRLRLFLKTRRVAVFLDESQKIKNPSATLTKTLLDLSRWFTRRVIMTGTPVANRPYDLWAQIKFLDHGAALGDDFGAFRERLDLSNDLVRDKTRATAFEEALATVFGRIRHFTVRETKKTAAITLPDKQLQSVSVELEARQAEIYHRYRDDLAAIVVREGKPLLDDAEEMLKRLLRLVQVASQPALVDDAYHAIPGKFPILEQLVAGATDAGEKIIVWTAFTDNVDWLAKELREFGTVRVHGKQSMVERNAAIHAFKHDVDCNVLVATPASAKEGLTLTVANHAVFYDRSFSLDDYLQAQDRIHRISQDKECYVTSLIGASTIDEWVEVLLEAKNLAANLAQGDITREEFKQVISYDFGAMVRAVLGLGDKCNERE